MQQRECGGEGKRVINEQREIGADKMLTSDQEASEAGGLMGVIG